MRRISEIIVVLSLVSGLAFLTACTSANSGGLVGAALGSAMGLPTRDIQKMSQLGTIAGGYKAYKTTRQVERDRKQALELERERLDQEKKLMQSERNYLDNQTVKQDYLGLAITFKKGVITGTDEKTGKKRLYGVLIVKEVPYESNAWREAGIQVGDALIQVEDYVSETADGLARLYMGNKWRMDTPRGMIIKLLRKQGEDWAEFTTTVSRVKP
jgi:hypothetical protein